MNAREIERMHKKLDRIAESQKAVEDAIGALEEMIEAKGFIVHAEQSIPEGPCNDTVLSGKPIRMD